VDAQDPAIRPTCGGNRGGDLEWIVVRGHGQIPGYDQSGDFFASSTYGNTLLQFNLHLQRRPDYFVNNVVLWLLVAVLIAWLSFFVSRYAAPARVGMSFTCLLAIYNLQGSVLRLLPRLSEDVWLLTFMNATLWFVVFAMVECVAWRHSRRCLRPRPHSAGTSHSTPRHVCGRHML
jgi:hypothetical protein